MTARNTETLNPAADTGERRQTPRDQGKPTKRRTRRSGAKPKADLYTEVTGKIIRELEAGRFPWAQPWRAMRGTAGNETATIAAGLPKNAATGRAYSGINILLLWG